jgi:hypothetical protein
MATNGMTKRHPLESQHWSGFTLLTCPATMGRSFHLSFRTFQRKGPPHPALPKSTPEKLYSEIWVNGHFPGSHLHGCTSFESDLTPCLNPPGQKNVLAVHVRNEGKNSRCYSGSGIYRAPERKTFQGRCLAFFVPTAVLENHIAS